MKDNILKKEFKVKDVTRIRNLVTGKYGDKTSTSIGYTKKTESYNEGDIWEENGRTWTIKNGIKQNITKLDSAKKIHNTPLFCPNCKKVMKKSFDSDYFKIHKKCFDCVIEFETDLKAKGLWEEYNKKIHNSEIDNFINNYKTWVEEMLKDSNQSYITEAGDVEKWKGGPNTSLVLNSLEETIKYLENIKK
jgi:hypothetical protein